MTNLAIMPWGYWSGGNQRLHAFLANSGIITPGTQSLREGKVMPFMGAESNPGDYGLANKLAKVYRKTYDKQKDNLIFQIHKQEKVPAGWPAKLYRCYSDYTMYAMW